MSEPWAGGTYGDRGRCVLAPNPGIMTLDGTNTWVLREPGAERSIVVDPGPLDDAHLDAVAAAAGQVDHVLVTHHHIDHTEAARGFAERMGCGVRALDPDQCWRADPVTDGEVIDVAGLRLEVLTTPGHTADSISLLVADDRALLTGDMVLGRGTTVIVHPDGDLGGYFDSIARMRALVTDGRVDTLWPAHGPVLRRRRRGARLLRRPPARAARPGRGRAHPARAVARRAAARRRRAPHPAAPGGRGRLLRRRRVALGRGRVVGPRPAGLPRHR